MRVEMLALFIGFIGTFTVANAGPIISGGGEVRGRHETGRPDIWCQAESTSSQPTLINIFDLSTGVAQVSLSGPMGSISFEDVMVHRQNRPSPVPPTQCGGECLDTDAYNMTLGSGPFRWSLEINFLRQHFDGFGVLNNKGSNLKYSLRCSRML